ncbi:hypothetical protein KIV40_18185 [Vibrio sp. D173a]|uniref:hypothetical protein n=1 Tax=Vibrio sp. D173a TaxID=2836349 RepID=UPI0025545F2B|nr:hypothetical protein [Vibrio sp. D173a]MDK9757269.1 hypothetical protein [Vibrio sp. D173a]
MKESNPFKNWQQERIENKKNLLKQALALLERTNFKNVTALAVTAADLMTELGGNSTKPINHSTLLRTSSPYRELLISFMERGSGQLNSEDTITDIDVLKAENLRLQHTISLYEAKLDHLLNKQGIDNAVNFNRNDELFVLQEKMRLLLSITDRIYRSVHDVFVLIDEQRTNEEYPSPGLYDIHGLVINDHELIELDKLRSKFL